MLCRAQANKVLPDSMDAGSEGHSRVGCSQAIKFLLLPVKTYATHSHTFCSKPAKKKLIGELVNHVHLENGGGIFV